MEGKNLYFSLSIMYWYCFMHIEIASKGSADKE